MNTATLKTSLAMLALSTVIASGAASADSAISLPAASADVTPLASPAQTSAITIEINRTLLPVTAYQAQNGDVTMLPLRAVAEQLGYSVKWSQADRSATISKDGVSAAVKTTVEEYAVNGISASLPVAPEMTKGQLHVPAAFIENALHASVAINAGAVSITTQAQDAQQPDQPVQQQSAQSNGVITAIHESDKYASVLIQGIGPDGLVLNVSEDTIYQRADGTKLQWSDLQLGMTVQADHSLAMTLSLPPQTPTYAITVLDTELPGELLGTAGTVEEIRTNKQGHISYVVKGQGLTDLSQDEIVLQSSADTAIVDKEGKPVEQSSIKQGTKVIGFYQPEMTKSLPAISQAVKIVVEAELPSEQ
ncbi:copper amine oxidase N-terminal domain-containing protein [Paenibacillus lentus]|uniref:copper amine oxidase N-terminal domain-containing protein n=1 Tax=Paenibacillus lentus TaxID=1338368 RepID=UPI00364B51E2